LYAVTKTFKSAASKPSSRVTLRETYLAFIFPPEVESSPLVKTVATTASVPPVLAPTESKAPASSPGVLIVIVGDV